MSDAAERQRRWRQENPERSRTINNRADTARNLDPAKREKRLKQQRDHMREKYKENPREFRNRSYLARYGISLDAYEAMEKKQNGLCAICGKPETSSVRGVLKRLALDHCHESSKIRGLLCSSCNQGLGRFMHDVAILEAAVLYLRGDSCPSTS